MIVAVDNVVGRARDRARPDEQAAAFGVTPWTGWARARGATAAVAALVLVLSFAWVTDFRSDQRPGRRGAVGAGRGRLAGRLPARPRRRGHGPVDDPSSVVIPCANLRR